MSLTAWTMHGEGCTELQIEYTSECTELCIYPSVVQIKEMNCFVNAKDVDTCVLGKCHVITAGGTTNSNKGHVILIMWQYALTGVGESIQWYKVHIDDMSMKVGGIQQQKMIDGFIISLNTQHGSPLHMVKGQNGLLYIMVHNTDTTFTDGIPSMDCDYNVLRLCFTWLWANVVKMTLAETTQHACMPLDTMLRKHYKSPDPVLNVMKHDELVYMDATWLDAPTIDRGVTNNHNLTVTLFCLEHQSAVSMIKLGYTSCSSA